MSTVLNSINNSLNMALSDDPQVILMGEDILDPYGGAFKVTRGLSTQFPDRVIATPISEAGIVGVATGMALRGFKPIVEIMFGDFSTLVLDQVINHLAKFGEMYWQANPLPVVIRTPMGGRRGYGPTHSQTIERLFFGFDGLKVVSPSHFIGYCGELLYEAVVRQIEPTIFIENKLQYLLETINPFSNRDLSVKKDEDEPYSPLWINLRDAPKANITLFTYGYMLDLAIKSMLELAYSEEIFINIIAFTQLSPFKMPEKLINEIGDNPILIVEEGTMGWGWGAEVAAQLASGHRHRQVRRLAATHSLIPAALQLENKVLPQVSDIISVVKTMRG